MKNKKLSYTAARESIVSRLKLGLHSMRSGGATAAANSDINDRVWKRHGRWKSDSSKDGYVVNSVDKGCKCLKILVCSFLLNRFPLYLKVFYRTRRASRQHYFDVNLISYQCMDDEYISCDLSIFYILY